MHLKCSRASWELLFGWHKLHLASFRLSQMPLEVVCRLPFAACRLPLHESQHSRPSSLSKSFVLFAFFLRFSFPFCELCLCYLFLPVVCSVANRLLSATREMSGGWRGEVLSFCISIIYLTCHPVLGSINIVNNTVNTPQHVAQTA